MKLKSTLWTLAVALAVVSCSDELDENIDSGNQGNGVNGSKTYMKVSINPGVTTRAASVTGGEEGEGEGMSEAGEENEYKVDDVTVILYTDQAGNTPTSFTADSKLVAAGYASTPNMSASDETWHKRMTTVEVEVTDSNESFDGNTYGVITVTNLGNQDLKDRIGKDITTGAQLANLLQTNAWTYSGSSYSKFIMSTHNDQYGSSTKIMDVVTLQANATPENAPETDVHVERLAAKIRLAADEDITDFIYTIGEATNPTAKVRLDAVKIANKLTSGSYLLKRVSETVTSADNKTIPSKTNGHDNYLGNEIWVETTPSFNYVIDPWTRSKTEKNLANVISIAGNDITTTEGQTTTLKYDNQLTDLNDYDTMWSTAWGEDEGKTLAGNTEFANQAKVLLCYTQENTTSAEMSKNGYSTGAIFKATFFPKQWAAVNAAGDEVEVVDIDYNGETEGTGFDVIDEDTDASKINFYVYNGNIYKDYEAIFNESAWTNQVALDNQIGATIYSYDSFNKTNIASVGKKAFFESELAKFSDPFGYIAYLKNLCDTDGDKILDSGIDESAMFTTDNSIEAYMASKTGKAAVDAAVTHYKGCVCYYPYWIRHAGKQNTNMQPMEFAIVRNNIYDLSVGAINKLGVSGTKKPEPDKDDETEDLLFRVNILVKNWVVRSNSGIIL